MDKSEIIELIHTSLPDIKVSPDELKQVNWSTMYPNTGGPFSKLNPGMICGQAFTEFTINAWVVGDKGPAVIMCKGQVLEVQREFDDTEYRNE